MIFISNETCKLREAKAHISETPAEFICPSLKFNTLEFLIVTSSLLEASWFH